MDVWIEWKVGVADWPADHSVLAEKEERKPSVIAVSFCEGGT